MKDRTQLDESSDPETPFQRLLQLSKSDDVEVRRALIDNPSIAVDESGAVTNKILLTLAKKFPDDVAGCSAFALFGLEMKRVVMLAVVEVLAENVKDPRNIVLLLNEFGPAHSSVRWRIARHPKTPEYILRFLADKNNEPMWHVRRAVAQNPITPQDLLCFLADKNNEPSLHVREGVARNPNTPQDVLRFLGDKSNEPEAYVREGVAENSNTPPDVLRFMANKDNEPEEHVRNSATKVLKERGLR